MTTWAVPTRVAESKFDHKVLDELLHNLETAPGQANKLLRTIQKGESPMGWFNRRFRLSFIMLVRKEPIRASFTAILKNMHKCEFVKEFMDLSQSSGTPSALALNVLGDNLGTLVLHDLDAISLPLGGWWIQIATPKGKVTVETIETFCQRLAGVCNLSDE